MIGPFDNYMGMQYSLPTNWQSIVINEWCRDEDGDMASGLQLMINRLSLMNHKESQLVKVVSPFCQNEQLDHYVTWYDGHIFYVYF